VLLATRLAPSVGLAVLGILVVQAEVWLFQGVGFFFSALVPGSGLVVVAVVVVTYFFAFNGFFQPFSLMAAWYAWLRWTCFLTYSFQLMMHIVLPEWLHFECAQPPAISAFPSCSRSTFPNGTVVVDGVITGLDVLDQYEVDMSPGLCIGVLLGAGLAFRVLAYIVYLRKMQPPKGIVEGESSPSRAWCGCCRRNRTKTKATDAADVPPNANGVSKDGTEEPDEEGGVQVV